MAVRSLDPCWRICERSSADETSGQPSPLWTSSDQPSRPCLPYARSPRMAIASLSAPGKAPADGKDRIAVGSRSSPGGPAPTGAFSPASVTPAESACLVNVRRDLAPADPGRSGPSLSCPAIVGPAPTALTPDGPSRSESGRTGHACLSTADAPGPEGMTVEPDATTPGRAMPAFTAEERVAATPGARRLKPDASVTPTYAGRGLQPAARAVPRDERLGQPTAESAAPPLPTGLTTRPGSGHPRPRLVVVIDTSPRPPITIRWTRSNFRRPCTAHELSREKMALAVQIDQSRLLRTKLESLPRSTSA